MPGRHTAAVKKIGVAAILLACVALAACAGRGDPAGSGGDDGIACRDIVSLPQDLREYAEAAGESRVLVPAAVLAASAREQKDRLFRPWDMSSPPRRLASALNKNFNLKADNAYGEDLRPFSPEIWRQIENNCDKAGYPSVPSRGITLRHTNLRAMPTALPLYLNPRLPGEGFPFDYFQHSSLPVGTPVFICHSSADRRWLLVESPLAAGWLPAGDVAETDEGFVGIWRSRPLAALLRDNVLLGASAESIGALLPLAEDAPPGPGHALRVFLPARGEGGGAVISAVALGPGDAARVPLPLTPAAVAEVGNRMMGQPYGWGGLARRRDCSALTRDLFAPFGIWLPRNSSRQIKVGETLLLDGLGNDEKEAAVLGRATPFLSLIWLPGHIGVYVGRYQGKPVMFHSIWGLRTRDAEGGCTGRAVVGKAVVTTLRPGAERADICSPASILDRVRRVAILPGSAAAAAGDEDAGQ
jgi:hypothetical protein